MPSPHHAINATSHGGVDAAVLLYKCSRLAQLQLLLVAFNWRLKLYLCVTRRPATRVLQHLHAHDIMINCSVTLSSFLIDEAGNGDPTSPTSTLFHFVSFRVARSRDALHTVQSCPQIGNRRCPACWRWCCCHCHLLDRLHRAPNRRREVLHALLELLHVH